MKAKKEIKKEEPASIPVATELPRLLYYNRQFFYTVNFPELFADLLLIVFSFFVSHELFSASGVFQSLQSWQISAMYCIVVLTLPWYLGYIYVRNAAHYAKGVMKIFLWTFILMVLMILIYLIRLVVNGNLEESVDLSGPDEFTAAFSMFLLVLGPMMCMGGAASAKNSFSPEGSKSGKFDPNNMMATGALFMIVGAIAFMIYFTGLFPPDSGGWVAVVAYLGGPFASVIVFGIFLGFLHLLDRIGIYKYFAIIAQNSFPFFITAVLVFWSGIAIHFMKTDFTNPEGGLSMAGMLFSVCVSGLIPFRIIMMFNAPLRIVNIVIGIFTLTYFLWQMMGLVN